MIRVIAVVDVDPVFSELLTEGDRRDIGRAAVDGASQLIRAKGDLWNIVLHVHPVRYELDGDPTVYDAPF